MGASLDVRLVGARLRDARKRLGMRQADLACLLGAAASWISDLENGKQRGPAAETIVRLARALGVSTDFLLGMDLAADGEDAT